MAATVIRTDRFDPDAFTAELARAADNREVGTRLRFENDRVRVWELYLPPGGRVAFHAHALEYFWTVVDGGTGRQRTAADGMVTDREYHPGDTLYVVEDPEHPTLHDFENIGRTTFRIITVELVGPQATSG